MARIRVRGFTLIEVLVVVAIIALLASIVTPAFREARRVSKRTVCLHNIEQIRIGMQSYLQMNKDQFPNVAQFPLREEEIARTATPPRRPFPSLPLALKNEMAGKSKAFECPADEIQTDDPVVRATGFRRYYDMQGTSYEFWPWLCGKKLHPRTMAQIVEEWRVPIKKIPMVYDIEVFHTSNGDKKQLKAFNAMYVDFEIRSDVRGSLGASPPGP